MSVSGGQSWNKDRQESGSSTQFPNNFLKQMQDVFGPGFGVNELIAALPKSQGLFGGTAGITGSQPSQPPAGQPAPGSPPSSLGMGALAQQTPPLPGSQPGTSSMPVGQTQVPIVPGQGQPQQPMPQTGSPGPVQSGPGRTYSQAELGGYATTGREQMRLSAVMEYLNRTSGDGRHTPGSYTSAELAEAANKVLFSDAKRKEFMPVLARIAEGEQVQNQMPTGPRFQTASPGPGLDNALPGGIGGSVSSLGFGQKGPEAQVQDIRTLPTINAAQVGLTNQPGFEKSLFESQFRPVERELSRQGGLADQRLNAELAQRGLGGSGTGVGQVQRQRREVGQQIQFAAEDAANRASVQSYNLASQERMANAGFDQQAQIENARNVLLGDTAKADNYLKTIGLNADNAVKEKDSFLKLLGLQQADLARMDQNNLAVVDRLLNTWLQTASVLSGAGQIQKGTTEAHGHSINQSVGVNYSGGS